MFSGLLGNDALLDLSGLTNAITDVIELRTTNNAMTNNIDMTDGGAVIGERALNADAVAHTTDGEGPAETAALHLDNDTLKVLKTLTGTFNDLNVYADGIADLKLGKIGTELLFFEFLNDVCHNIDPFFLDVHNRHTARGPSH